MVGLIKVVIVSLFLHEFLVRSSLHHAAPLYHGDGVCVLDRGEAMRDDDAGSTLLGSFQGLLDHLRSREKRV